MTNSIQDRRLDESADEQQRKPFVTPKVEEIGGLGELTHIGGSL